jgi:hypothetical protein
MTIKETEELKECLQADCGFTQNMAVQFISCMEQSKWKEQLRTLEKQRKMALDELHGAQNRIDCIDFVINKVKQECGK